jgi:hypothetical protein
MTTTPRLTRGRGVCRGVLWILAIVADRLVGGGWARRGEAFRGVSLDAPLEVRQVPPESPPLPQAEGDEDARRRQPERHEGKEHIDS